MKYQKYMMKKNITGTINFTNPGLISHNEILEMYKEIVDNNFTWTNFTKEEQSKRFKKRILKTPWKFSETDEISRVNWDEYTDAANELFYRTGTEFAPPPTTLAANVVVVASVTNALAPAPAVAAAVRPATVVTCVFT